MAREDLYREWNALNELRARLPELTEEETAAAYDSRLAAVLQPGEAVTNLPRAVLRGWRVLEDSPELVRGLRASLGYEEAVKGFRLESLPGADIPLRPGKLYCCPTEGCGASLFQLFDGQQLTCPGCKGAMHPCPKVENPKP